MLDLVEDDYFPFAKQILNELANDAVNDVNSNAHLSVESFQKKNSFHQPENMIKYLNDQYGILFVLFAVAGCLARVCTFIPAKCEAYLAESNVQIRAKNTERTKSYVGISCDAI